jgi:ADP-ribose pyrophosphatase YjhB (NUDIX family)
VPATRAFVIESPRRAISCQEHPRSRSCRKCDRITAAKIVQPIGLPRARRSSSLDHASALRPGNCRGILSASSIWTAQCVVNDVIRYCGYCGNSLVGQAPELRDHGRIACATCGWIVPAMEQHHGPALLVLVAVFANDHLLLLRRGLSPYRGQWAPPGGFVERGESLEAAAVREVWEEVRVKLDPAQLLPCAVISLPELNQIHYGFIARLPSIVPASAAPPESLEVGWFSECECRQLDSWAPAARLDVSIQFEFFRSRAFGFIQQTDAFMRLITTDGFKYL